jgi:hypothetical protein
MMPKLFGNPYVLLGGAALLIATHATAYLQGRGDGAASVQAKYAQATGKALAAMRRGEATIQMINGRFTAATQIQTTNNREIRNAAQLVLSRPVYASPCVDADGVGLLDRARANANLSLDSGELADGATGASGDAARE